MSHLQSGTTHNCTCHPKAPASLKSIGVRVDLKSHCTEQLDCDVSSFTSGSMRLRQKHAMVMRHLMSLGCWGGCAVGENQPADTEKYACAQQLSFKLSDYLLDKEQ